MNHPRTLLRLGLPAVLAGTLLLFLFGCGTVGGGYTEVYGDYGYAGLWAYGPFVPEGYDFGRPPYARPEGGHDHHPPPGHQGPRPPPSIPNHPRPSGGGGGSRGGGGGHSGGGHSGGGGSSGGGGGSSGGSGPHR